MTVDLLPSWRPGPTRDALVSFMDAAALLPVERRLAVFDNDGTLWCERPTYVQFEFFVHVLQRAVERDPALATREEFTAVLAADWAAIGEMGLVRVALALAGLFEGEAPEAFASQARDFFAVARHPVLGIPAAATVYRPMLELIDELRRRRFTVAIVTGGGTEFVRAISGELYGVPPELVVGTLIGHTVGRDAGENIGLWRTGTIIGPPNEGEAKVVSIQACLGRRPILAAGNSAGDREMLEWSLSGADPGLALLVDHDDADREFEYRSPAGPGGDGESVREVGRRLGWTVVSMDRDWSEVFSHRGSSE